MLQKSAERVDINVVNHICICVSHSISNKVEIQISIDEKYTYIYTYNDNFCYGYKNIDDVVRALNIFSRVKVFANI